MTGTTAGRNAACNGFTSAATHGSVYTTAIGGTAPNQTAGTEPTGGSPAFARKALTWGSVSAGANSASATFDIPSGTTIVAAGVHTALTGGSYLDGGSVTSQNFASQGTYTVTYTNTQT